MQIPPPEDIKNASVHINHVTNSKPAGTDRRTNYLPYNAFFINETLSCAWDLLIGHTSISKPLWCPCFSANIGSIYLNDLIDILNHAKLKT